MTHLKSWQWQTANHKTTDTAPYKEPGTGVTKQLSYTLSREYRVVRSRYSRLLFTSEDCLCANLHVQEQWTNMTSQC